MKKILTLALCIAAAGSMSAQKSVVDQALKLAGKNDKIGNARELIQQAASNPETANDARTYYVAGKIEYDAFDNSFKKQMINPKDASVNPMEMGQQLLNGYKQFIKAMSLDSVPNAKGQIKPQFSKDIASRINGHFNDYFNAGGTFYNEKKFYPEAYEAFMIFGSIPKAHYAVKTIAATPDSVINTAFFNAGLSAYAGDNLEAAAKGFKSARLNGTDNEQNFIYEIACWQYLAQRDSTKSDLAKKEIKEIAEDGYKKFGIAQPLFLNNLINSYVMENKYDDAIKAIQNVIVENPDKATLYGLLGYVYDRKGDDDASVAAYKKSFELPDADYETLKNASKKIFKVGTQKWNNIEGAPQSARDEIKNNYFILAKNITDKAKTLNKDNDPDLDYVVENIDYALDTYFSK